MAKYDWVTLDNFPSFPPRALRNPLRHRFVHKIFCISYRHWENEGQSRRKRISANGGFSGGALHTVEITGPCALRLARQSQPRLALSFLSVVSSLSFSLGFCGILIWNYMYVYIRAFFIGFFFSFLIADVFWVECVEFLVLLLKNSFWVFGFIFSDLWFKSGFYLVTEKNVRVGRGKREFSLRMLHHVFFIASDTFSWRKKKKKYESTFISCKLDYLITENFGMKEGKGVLPCISWEFDGCESDYSSNC